jgi:hypothetical protein
MEKRFEEFRDAYFEALTGTETNQPWEKRKDIAFATASRQVYNDAPILMKEFTSFFGQRKPKSDWTPEAIQGQRIATSMAQGMRKYNASLNGHSNGNGKTEVVEVQKARRSGKRLNKTTAYDRYVELCSKFDTVPGDIQLGFLLGMSPTGLTSYRSKLKKEGYAFTASPCGWNITRQKETITPSDLEALREIVSKFGLKLS